MQRHPTITGEIISIDTRDDVVVPSFGFQHNDIVKFMKSRDAGKRALVIGVHDSMLWFKMERKTTNRVTAPALTPSDEPNEEVTEFEDAVRTTSCRCHAEYIRQFGWMKLLKLEKSP